MRQKVTCYNIIQYVFVFIRSVYGFAITIDFELILFRYGDLGHEVVRTFVICQIFGNDKVSFELFSKSRQFPVIVFEYYWKFCDSLVSLTLVTKLSFLTRRYSKVSL